MPFTKSKVANVFIIIGIVAVGMLIGWFLANKNPPADNRAELKRRDSIIAARTAEVDSIKLVITAKDQQDIADRLEIEALRNLMQRNNIKLDQINRTLNEKLSAIDTLDKDALRRHIAEQFKDK